MQVLDSEEMDSPVKRNATYADVDSLPDGWVGEIIDGDLYAFGRPRITHAVAIHELAIELATASRDRTPKGWIVLSEVEIWFGKKRRNLLVPDLAGWRRERLAEIPDVQTLDLVPDWVCEGLSPSTASLDRGKKREIYAKHGVSHVWFVDPSHRTLEVLALEGRHYSVLQTGGGSERGVFAPFTHEIDLGRLWER